MQSFTKTIQDETNRNKLFKKFEDAWNYLKLRFERHCNWEDDCISHCIKCALSSPTDKQLQESCNRNHKCICQDCYHILESVDLLVTEMQNISDEREKEHNLIQIEKSLSEILSWQQHIIRGSQQDKAKAEALKNLSSSNALWIRDWAQKVLPGAGLEAQDVSFNCIFIILK